jgi:hypothetical protein
METKLLPCPFCGGPAEIVGAGEGGWVVQCRPCAATSGEGDPISIPIAAWNRRVERTAPTEGEARELVDALTRAANSLAVHPASPIGVLLIKAASFIERTAALNPKPEVSK